MKKTIELSDDMIDDLITQTLSRDLHMELDAIKRLEAKDHLGDFEMEDLKDFKKRAKALKRVLKYYGGIID